MSLFVKLSKTDPELLHILRVYFKIVIPRQGNDLFLFYFYFFELIPTFLNKIKI